MSSYTCSHRCKALEFGGLASSVISLVAGFSVPLNRREKHAQKEVVSLITYIYVSKPPHVVQNGKSRAIFWKKI